MKKGIKKTVQKIAKKHGKDVIYTNPWFELLQGSKAELEQIGYECIECIQVPNPYNPEPMYRLHMRLKKVQVDFKVMTYSNN